MRKHIFQFLGILLAVFVLSAGLVYGAGVVYFQNHFPFQTSFMGRDVSQQTVDVLEDIMQEESEEHTVTIHELDGNTETLNLAATMDYTRTVPEPAEGWIPEDSSWYWPLSLKHATELPDTEEITYSPAKLTEAVYALDAMDPDNITEPQDAYVLWEDGKCHIVPEVEGNKLHPEMVADLLTDAVKNEKSDFDLTPDCYYAPEIRSDNEDLVKEVSKYESINFQQITLEIADAEIVLTSDDVLAFYRHGTGDSGLEEAAVAEYVAGLKEEYDTYERQRPFVDHYGNEIMVGTWADTYGFKMDADATTQLLIDTLNSKETVTISPVWINEGLVREENGSDIGDTYIEVSINEQHLWAYVDGEQVFDTDVVTGNTGNHDTPRGVFRILSKAQSTYLVGDGYRSFVNYWMQINWSGVGLHDASWRSSYGGNIYTYSGSHGCINMPFWAAQQAYETFSTETPVVVW